MNLKRIGAGVAKVAGVVLASHLAIFYFRLGWFLPIVWAAGLVFALLLTKREWASTGSRTVAITAVAVLYATLTAAAWQLLFDRKSETVFEMTWADKGDANSFSEPEIVLSFTQFPGHAIGIYSRQLEDSLAVRGDAPIEVAFETTRDFGRLRGYREIRIAGLTSWQSKWGYASSDGSTRPPWGAKDWWCPRWQIMDMRFRS